MIHFQLFINPLGALLRALHLVEAYSGTSSVSVSPSVRSSDGETLMASVPEQASSEAEMRAEGY